MSAVKQWRQHAWAAYPPGHAHAGSKGCLRCGMPPGHENHVRPVTTTTNAARLAEYQPSSTRGLSSVKRGLIGSRLTVRRHGASDYIATIDGVGELLFNRADLRFEE